MTPLFRLIDSPIRFMQARAASRPPRLLEALSPVVLNALFASGTSIIMQVRLTVLAPGLTEPVPSSLGLLPVPVMLLMATVVGLIAFALHAGTVIGFDMLTVQSAEPKRWRLVELSALAYWPQLLWSAPALAVTWWFYDPPTMVLKEGSDMMQAAIRYGEQLAREPLQIMVTRTQQFAGLWLVGLHAVALRVVSGFSVGATWGAFITLAALFVGIPWMFRLAVQRAVL